MCAQSRRTRRGRPRLPIPKTLPDDLYDYSGDPALSTALQRRIPSPDAFDVEKLPVIDDWPHCVPVTDAEVDIFERYFGDVLDRLFGHKAAECETEGLHSLTPNVNKKAMSEDRDPSLDTLLDLHGQVLVVDPEDGHWVKFVVTRVPVSSQKPHGLGYSLTLHGPSGERLVGFDNAHPVGRGRRGEPMDHRHRLQTVKHYAYEDAATLLADFWQAADTVLKERGVL